MFTDQLISWLLIPHSFWLSEQPGPPRRASHGNPGASMPLLLF